MLPPVDGEPYGLGDIVDFALGMLVFLVGGICAASALALHLGSDDGAHYTAFRPAVVGITAFAVYYFLHPYVPRLL